MLGLVSFMSQIPTFVLSPFAGILADRWDRRGILIFTQTISMVQAFILAFLTLTGAIQVWHVVVLGTALGVVCSLDVPARHSFVMDLVSGRKEILSNAIALHSFMFNLARLIGPSIAGIFIAVYGEGTCFFVNGISFVAVLLALLAMQIKPKVRGIHETHVFKGIADGVRYTFGYLPIRSILILVGMLSMAGMSYVVLMPVFAKEILHGGPRTLGVIMASAGLGSVLATVFLASRKSAKRFGYTIPLSAMVFSVGLIILARVNTLWIAMIFLALSGFGAMICMVSCNTVIQTVSDDDKRGRVMSFYTMAFLGMAPIGSFISGFLASKVGVANALTVGGILCFGVAIYYARKVPLLRELVQPVYDRINQMPSETEEVI